MTNNFTVLENLIQDIIKNRNPLAMEDRALKRKDTESDILYKTLLGESQAALRSQQAKEEARLNSPADIGQSGLYKDITGKELPLGLTQRQFKETYAPTLGFLKPPAPSTRTDTDRINKIITSFNSHPETTRHLKMIDSASTIREIADINNPIGDNSLATFMARASGEVGNLAEHDKEPFGGSSAFNIRFKRAKDRAISGKLDSVDRAFIVNLSNTFYNSASKNLSTLAKRTYNQYKRKNPILELQDLDPNFVQSEDTSIGSIVSPQPIGKLATPSGISYTLKPTKK